MGNFELIEFQQSDIAELINIYDGEALAAFEAYDKVYSVVYDHKLDGLIGLDNHEIKVLTQIDSILVIGAYVKVIKEDLDYALCFAKCNDINRIGFKYQYTLVDDDKKALFQLNLNCDEDFIDLSYYHTHKVAIESKYLERR